MARHIEPRWCERDRCWLVPFGSYDEAHRRRRYVTLRDEDGRKIDHGDERGKTMAFARLLAMEEEAGRRRGGPTAGDVIAAYLDWHKEKGSRRSTIKGHFWHLAAFGKFELAGVPYCDRPAASIGIADLSRARKAMEAKGAQTGYVRLFYASVLACWRWAARPVEGREPERMIEADPFEGLQRPRAGAGRKTVVPWTTCLALLEFAERRTAELYPPARPLDRLKVLCLRLVIESGCRPHEAAELEWAWVREAERVCVIPWESHKTGAKTRDDRVVAMTEGTAERLATLRASGASHPRWVFATAGEERAMAPKRKSFGYWFQKLKSDALAAGLDLPKGTTPYAFRHSLVSQARAGGVSFRDMARVMGHDEAVAERVYAHLETGSAREQFDRMHAARQGQSGGG